jgi:hypothetical protein
MQQGGWIRRCWIFCHDQDTRILQVAQQQPVVKTAVCGMKQEGRARRQEECTRADAHTDGIRSRCFRCRP